MIRSGQKYRLKRIALFYCGCIYQTNRVTPFICPTHRMVVTGIERMIYHETPVTIHRLTMHPLMSNNPYVMDNNEHNSLTSKEVIYMDGEEWDTGDEFYGLCNACYIEGAGAHPTDVSQCGCRNDECQYRWCGATQGLHSFYRMHVAQDYGLLTDDIESFERDIFSDGHEDGSCEDVQEGLKEERQWILEHAHQLLRDAPTKHPELLFYLGKKYLNEPIPSRSGTFMDVERKAVRLIATGVVDVHVATKSSDFSTQLSLFDGV